MVNTGQYQTLADDAGSKNCITMKIYLCSIWICFGYILEYRGAVIVKLNRVLWMRIENGELNLCVEIGGVFITYLC